MNFNSINNIDTLLSNKNSHFNLYNNDISTLNIDSNIKHAYESLDDICKLLDENPLFDNTEPLNSNNRTQNTPFQDEKEIIKALTQFYNIHSNTQRK